MDDKTWVKVMKVVSPGIRRIKVSIVLCVFLVLLSIYLHLSLYLDLSRYLSISLLVSLSISLVISRDLSQPNCGKDGTSWGRHRAEGGGSDVD